MTIVATQARKRTPSTVFHGQSTYGASGDRPRDLVTAIFDVLIETHPGVAEIREQGEAAVRHRLLGLRGTVTPAADSDTMAVKVLALFNGRNAREVARKLGISRASVYRHLKQSGRPQA